jgi:hypothetical protein
VNNAAYCVYEDNISSQENSFTPISAMIETAVARAVVKSNVDEKHNQVGAKHDLTDEDSQELDEEYKNASKDMSVTAASIKVEGYKTTFSLSFKNARALRFRSLHFLVYLGVGVGSWVKMYRL